MTTNKKTARIAGLVYLVVVVTGIISLIYIPSKLIVWNDASTTFNNIAAAETLFRFGIVSGLICYTAFLVLPLVLYKLLRFAGKTPAILMVAFAVISVPISLLNLLNKVAVLTLVSGDEYLSAIEPGELHSQAMLYLEFYNSGNLVASIFWGLWLFPFGYLVFKSGILPRVFGVLLMLGCFGYLIDFLGYFFFSGYGKTLVPTVVGIPSGLGEIGICLWLLIMGAKERPTHLN